jgi:hypothetical protein
MSDPDHSIQYKAHYSAPADYGFEDGNLVPITGNNDEIESTPTTLADYAGLLNALTFGAIDAEEVGRRTLCMAYVFRSPDERGTLEDLGRALGLSKQRAHALLTKFRNEMP